VDLAVSTAVVTETDAVGASARALPEIPLIDIGAAGPVALFEARRDGALALMAAGCDAYGRIAISLADKLSHRWLERTDNPYLGELDVLARSCGHPGLYMLNLSYEWLCTTGVAPDPGGLGSRMLRTLDWPLEGLGRHVVVARFEGAAGPYFNVTWPGFIGVITAMAPGRFSAALNQAPMPRQSRLWFSDWVRARLGVWQGGGLPPAHLLRRIFDRCATFEEARAMLRETRVSLPGFFSLSGVAPGEGCVVERFDDRAVVHDAPVSVANHWLTPGLGGDPRGEDSYERQAMMTAANAARHAGFDWLRRPVLNDCTRLAVDANAAIGRLAVQGFESGAPATAVLAI